ncbi:LysR family transcriptional regulator [Paenibacillus sp. MWE-103]|uniref:LysR family transcriptional regulator n=1 Tax=Paenibacillus artemisiicola TaxID=1172618 RepID=A0ABS3W4W2_9BACL|nr:LysR family transcriptional regulator [Paenibacillus artemisiicola]MBO7743338.1 LysR family transcriptional regulator [Paenibacillus artemisiicola]
MDFKQLKYFLAIAEEKQITRAAKLLHMEQPPLSRQLMLMEEELGAKLFERGRKQLTLTAAGELLRSKAESLLAQLDETMLEVRELEEGVRGTLSIGAVVSCVSILPKPIRQLRAAYPQITFKITEGDHFLLGEMLAKRAIELVVSRLPFETGILPSKLSTLPLPSDPYVTVFPSSWVPRPRAGGEEQSIGMRELAEYPLLTLKTDNTIRMHEQVVNEFRRHGLEPNIICECSSVTVIMSLIASGIGATVFPKSILNSFPYGDVTMLPIRDANFQSDIGILWLKDHRLSKRAQHFLDYFQSDGAQTFRKNV